MKPLEELRRDLKRLEAILREESAKAKAKADMLKEAANRGGQLEPTRRS